MSEWELAGHIGVDAGIVMVGDPCYTLGDDASHRVNDWSKFCQGLGEEYPTCKQLEYGVVVSSGYGDGVYPVYVKRNSEGRIIAMKVEFD